VNNGVQNAFLIDNTGADSIVTVTEPGQVATITVLGVDLQNSDLFFSA